MNDMLVETVVPVVLRLRDTRGRPPTRVPALLPRGWPSGLPARPLPRRGFEDCSLHSWLLSS